MHCVDSVGHCIFNGKVGNSYEILPRGISWNIPLVTCNFLIGVHTRLKARVYSEKILVTGAIFHGIPLDRVE